MKDYSNLIPSSFGFITSYEIVGEKVHVYTPENKKGEPQIYPLSKLPEIEARLENQYQLIVENKKAVKASVLRTVINKVKKILILPVSVLAVAGIASIILSSYIISIPAFISLALTLLAGGITINTTSKRFDEEMIAAETYLENRKDIEETSEKDENVTEYLSEKTKQKINNNNELKTQGIIPETFNIDFLDKTSLKEMKKLLTRYMISKGLEQEQVFVSPKKKSNSKKRKKIKKR